MAVTSHTVTQCSLHFYCSDNLLAILKEDTGEEQIYLCIKITSVN